MTTRKQRRRSEKHRKSACAFPAPPPPEKIIEEIVEQMGHTFLQGCLKNFDCFAEKMLISLMPECHPLIKPFYLKARQSRQCREFLQEMDAPEQVQAYDLNRKLRELREKNGPGLSPPVHLLEPGELLLSAPFLLIAPENKIPKCFPEALDGLRTLWTRMIQKMTEEKTDLRLMENHLNDLIQEQGGWKIIKLKDRSYLKLLDPAETDEQGWSPKPRKYLQTLEQLWSTPNIEFKYSDPINHSRDIITLLQNIFHEPLSSPDKWHFPH